MNPFETDANELVYIADPMCSWCWGFSPVVRALAERYGDRAALRIIMGGLRPGTTAPMEAAMKRMIEPHWQHVAEATGQPFDHAFFDREGFVYDTEPPCRAVATVRASSPANALSYLAAVQRAFYAENRDVTDAAVLADIAAATGLDRAAFAAEFETDTAKERVAVDFAIARRIGATGFPTLFGNAKGKLRPLTIGYQPLEALAEEIDRWLASVH